MLLSRGLSLALIAGLVVPGLASAAPGSRSGSHTIRGTIASLQLPTGGGFGSIALHALSGAGRGRNTSRFEITPATRIVSGGRGRGSLGSLHRGESVLLVARGRVAQEVRLLGGRGNGRGSVGAHHRLRHRGLARHHRGGRGHRYVRHPGRRGLNLGTVSRRHSRGPLGNTTVAVARKGKGRHTGWHVQARHHRRNFGHANVRRGGGRKGGVHHAKRGGGRKGGGVQHARRGSGKKGGVAHHARRGGGGKKGGRRR